ncbi:uncharacterized protein K02A2.6-like [Eupeodes corollae]|uniref:uncharacterized protein K02A2.6-like n=1 Tax=Eupeodes corollae TaxID=290404 RepID=UPI002493232B|nr:uncharacterized protein K02A2.6-like [Eupeodes corollae]
MGSCIVHIFPNGDEKLISHAARPLTSAEASYSQIEREAAALIFAVKKFHRMIFGPKFLLLTDHKLLLAIFGSKKGIPIYTANRLQRWALTFMMYDFDIKYISTNEFGFVEVLSRLSNTKTNLDEDNVIASTIFEYDFKSNLLDTINTLPINFKMIQQATSNCKILQAVIKNLASRWKYPISPQISPYYARREGLAAVDGCIMFKDCIIISACFQKRILRQLHRGHPGIDKMKTVARCHVYWPVIDEDITSFVHQCHACASAAVS